MSQAPTTPPTLPATPDAPTAPPASGVKTSEFWQGLLVVMAGVFLIVFGAISNNDSLVSTGSILAGVQGVGYTAVRSLLKK